MLRLSETRDELKVVADQHGIPTSCVDLSFAISELINRIDDVLDEGKCIFHFSNSIVSDLSSHHAIKPSNHSVSWADFAREIFSISGKDTQVIDCSSNEYPTKARRPSYSILQNDSDILFPDWKIGLAEYLREN